MSDFKEMIIESTNKIMEKYSTKEMINGAEKGLWAGELWGNLAEHGMLTVGVPEDLGGSGGDYEDEFNILHLAGKYSTPIPIAETYMVNWLLAGLNVTVPNKILTIATEKENQPFTFSKQGEGCVVNGIAKNVPWARFAEKILVFGETSQGPILSLLDLERADIVHGKNMAGEARDQVSFNQVYVKGSLNIDINKDDYERRVLYCGAVAKIAMMTGALERILEITITHSLERSQFGRPLHRFQAIQSHLALLAGEVAAARIAMNYAIDAFGRNPFSNEIALAKIRVNEAAGLANRSAHQVLAAIGFTYEHVLHHSTRRLWSWREEFGKETDWEMVITEELLELEKDGLWSMITGVNSESRKVKIK